VYQPEGLCNDCDRMGMNERRNLIYCICVEGLRKAMRDRRISGQLLSANIGITYPVENNTPFYYYLVQFVCKICIISLVYGFQAKYMETDGFLDVHNLIHLFSGCP